MTTPTTVFEVVDATSDEQYWTLGIFLSFDEAKSAVDVPMPSDIGCSDHDDYDDFRKVEIRERAIGWGGSGKTVAKMEWESSSYDEKEDEFKWTSKFTIL